MNFDQSALDALENGIEEYRRDVANEAVYEARRDNLETIGEIHVRRAQRKLVARSENSKAEERFRLQENKKARMYGTVGGIFAGAGFGLLLSLLQADAFFGPLGIFGIMLTVIGAVLMGIGYRDEDRPIEPKE